MVFTWLNTLLSVYFKLSIVDLAFIWHPKLAKALYSQSNGFSWLIFTNTNGSIISAAYYTSNKYFWGLFKTPPWRPGTYLKPGIWLSKYGIKCILFIVTMLDHLFVQLTCISLNHLAVHYLPLNSAGYPCCHP